MKNNKALKIAVSSIVVVLVSAALATGILALIWYRNVSTFGNVLGVSWYNEKDSEFTITTAEELCEMAKLSDFYTFEGQTVKLGADIVLNEGNAQDWEKKAPADKWMPISRFAGTFDGQGHTISGLYANSAFAKNGLFVDTDIICTIKNFKLTNSYIENKGAAGTASIAAGGGGNFYKIYSDAIIRCEGELCGGIASSVNSQAIFEECWFDGSIWQTGRRMGGILGELVAGRVEMRHCLYTGHITSTDELTNQNDGVFAGGLCGQTQKGATINVSDSLIAGTIVTEHNANCSGSVFGRVIDTAQTLVSDTYDVAVFSHGNSVGNGITKGQIVKMPMKNMKGIQAYQWSTLDFDQYWAAVEQETPVLKCFAENSLNLEGIEKAYDTSWYNESGTEFKLSTLKELYGFYYLSTKNNFLKKTVLLDSDIVINEGDAKEWLADSKKVPTNPWFPIGTETNPFAGTFDGQGHSISGLYTDMAQNYNGLFGMTTAKSAIKNLKLVNSYIDSTGSNTAKPIGSIAGEMRGTMENVYSNAIIQSSSTEIGGLVGRLLYNDVSCKMSAGFSNCWFDGQLIGTAIRQAGGIVGTVGVKGIRDPFKTSVHFLNCLNTGYIHNDRISSTADNLGGQYLGGLIGNAGAHVMKMEGCVNAGVVDAYYKTFVGGVVGRLMNSDATLTVSNSYNVKECYGVAVGAIDAKLVGGVTNVPKSMMQGYNGFKFTELDFANAWAVVENSTPILKAFASKVPSLAGIQRMVDTSWYKEDAKEYVLSNVQDFYGFWLLSNSKTFEGKTIKLAADITINRVDKDILGNWKQGKASGVSPWLPIGTDTTPFKGTFDGQGHTISGIYMVNNQKNNGLFGVAGDGSVIKNLQLKDSCYYLMDSKEFTSIGSVVGVSSGLLETIYSDATIVTNGQHIGGIVGLLQYTDGTYKAKVGIKNSWFDGLLTGDIMRNAGGIAGGTAAYRAVTDASKYAVTFENCLNTGTIHNERVNSEDGLGGQYIGGIIGTSGGGRSIKMDGCVNAGTFDLKYKTYSGGLIGRIYYSENVCEIRNSYTIQGSHNMIMADTAGKLIGGGILLPDAALTGYNAYKLTDLDFKNWWTVVENDTPVLRSFASSTPSLAGKEKLVDTGWYDEKATEFVINNEKQLYGMWLLSNSTSFVGKTIKLGKDITINTVNDQILEEWQKGRMVAENNWLPIGTENMPFKGTFDGQGHSIRGLYSNHNQKNNGLFSVAGDGSVIRNLRLEDSCFYLYESAEYSCIGGIAGLSSGIIDTVYSEAIILTEGQHVGGVVGLLQYTDATYKAKVQVRNSWFNGLLSGKTLRNAGGIVGGMAAYSSVKNAEKHAIIVRDCLNTGTIHNERMNSDDGLGGQYLGGILGTGGGAKSIKVIDCVNNGIFDITYQTFAGGLIGRIYNSQNVCEIKDSYTTSESFATAISDTQGELIGKGHVVKGEMLKGRSAFLYTELDFYTNKNANGTWVATQEGVDLKAFSSSETQITDDKQIIRADYEWYEKDPSAKGFEIDTIGEFYAFAILVENGETFANKEVHLLKSIELNPNWKSSSKKAPENGLLWDPIGQANYNYSGEKYFFDGTFVGHGNTISSVYVANAGDGVGIFSVLGRHGKIQDLRITNSHIEQTGTGGTGTGALVGCLRGDLESIYVHSDVSVIGTTSGRTGGIVGETLEGGSDISLCWFAGQVSSKGQATGGIVGRASTKVSITNCLNTGTVTGGPWASGGIAGEFTPSREYGATLLISKCLSVGSITGNNWVGSFVGGTEEKSGTTYKIELKDSYYSTSHSAVGATRGACTVDNQSVNVTSEDLLGMNALTKAPKLFENQNVWQPGTVPILKKFGDVTDDGWYFGKIQNGAMPSKVTYEIGTLEEFAVFKDIVNSGDNFAGDTVKLTADIDMNPNWDATKKTAPIQGLVWPGIGSSSKPFAGTFDGDGHVIKGVYMDATGASGDGMGLFNYVNGATIKNVKLENSYYINSTSRWWSGAVVGWFNGGTMNKVSASDSVILNCGSFGAGGLVGLTRNADVYISGSQFNGYVSTTRRVGGIVGEQRSNTTIMDCLVNASVVSVDTKDNNPQAAAFVGCITSGKLVLENALALGEVKAPAGNNLGFVVGYAATTVKVKDVFYANKRVNTTGGIVNEPDVKYDTTGDEPVSKTITDLNSGNVLFVDSEAWIYEKNMLPTLK